MHDHVTACDRAAVRHLRLHGHRLHADLMARLRASVAAHRTCTTVRREDHRWRGAAPGLQTQCLRRNERFLVELWKLEAGVELQWPAGAAALEVLVATGVPCAEAVKNGRSAQETGYLTLAEPCELRHWISPSPTTLYVRQRLAPLAKVHPLEARWWRLAAVPRSPVRPWRWERTSPGVEVMRLRGDRHAASMLVRLEAGTLMPDHHHALGEEFLVLQGDMFVGDVLLRAGDYQRAPVSGSRAATTSDTGAIFYWHGALGPGPAAA